jgi:hypothetical protein
VPLCVCAVVLLLWFFVCVVLPPCGVVSLGGCRCASVSCGLFICLLFALQWSLWRAPPIGGKPCVVQPFAFDFACALCLLVCLCVCLFGCFCGWVSFGCGFVLVCLCASVRRCPCVPVPLCCASALLSPSVSVMPSPCLCVSLLCSNGPVVHTHLH